MLFILRVTRRAVKIRRMGQLLVIIYTHVPKHEQVTIAVQHTQRETGIRAHQVGLPFFFYFVFFRLLSPRFLSSSLLTLVGADKAKLLIKGVAATLLYPRRPGASSTAIPRARGFAQAR